MSNTREQQEAVAKIKMVELQKELLALPPIKDAPITYTLVENAGWSKATEICINVFPPSHSTYYKTLSIYTDTTTRGSYHSRHFNSQFVSYVRIKSDNHEIGAKRTLWTFETKGLAKRVQKRVAECYFQLLDLHINDLKRRSNEKIVTELMEKKFPKWNLYVNDEKATIRHNDIELTYYHGQQSYDIKTEGLTEKQIAKIIETVENPHGS